MNQIKVIRIMKRSRYLSKTAKKKVMTGRQFVVAAAKVADV